MMNIHIFLTLAFIFGASNCRPIQEDDIQTKPQDITIKIKPPMTNKTLVKTVNPRKYKRSILDTSYLDSWDFFELEQPTRVLHKNEANNFMLPFGDLFFQNEITPKLKPKKKLIINNYENREGAADLINFYQKKPSSKLFDNFLPDSLKNNSTKTNNSKQSLFKPWFNNNNNNNAPISIKNNSQNIKNTSLEAIFLNKSSLSSSIPPPLLLPASSISSSTSSEEVADYDELDLSEKGLFGNPNNRRKQFETTISTPLSNANKNTGIIIHKLKVRRGGVAIAGPGGIATAGRGGTAIVGPNGYAYTKPDSLTIAGAGTQVIAVHPDVNLKEIVEKHPHKLKGAGDKKRIGRIVAVGPVIYYNEG